MSKIIYVLVSIIIFFGFFCLTIYDFKKRNFHIKFSDWYFDKWFLLNIICSLLWYIAIPIVLII